MPYIINIFLRFISNFYFFQPINTTVKPEVTISEPIVAKPATIPKPVENKTTKQLKNEGEKVTKKSEKNKNEKIKKVKEEKKEELTEAKVKDKEVTDLGVSNNHVFIGQL